MNKLAILVFILACSFSAGAQQGTTVSIYFQSDSYVAATSELSQLQKTLNDRDCKSCSLKVTGHTDADGSDNYNQKLSENRIQNIKNYLKQNFTCFSIQEALAKGETEPINDNRNESEKQLNRRVLVEVICATKKETAEIEEPPVKPVWGDLISGGWQNSMNYNPYRNGYMDLPSGIKVIVDSGTYGSKDNDIVLQFYACTNRQQAFMNRFTTMTDTRLLESAGMFRMIATKDGVEVEPKTTDGIHVYIPMTADKKSGYQRFVAKEKENYTFWDLNNENHTESFFSPKMELDRMLASRDGNVGKCTFFWCKVKSFFSKSYRNRRNQQLTQMVTQNKDVMRVYDLFEKDLKKKFPNKEAFTAFLLNNDRETILNELGDQISNFDDISYFVLDLPNSKWINCDRFSGYTNLTDVELDEKYNAASDVRLFFDNQLSIMPATKGKNGRATFSQVPIGEIATLVIIKKLGEVLYLSKESFKIGATPVIKYRKINTSELNTVFPN